MTPTQKLVATVCRQEGTKEEALASLQTLFQLGTEQDAPQSYLEEVAKEIKAVQAAPTLAAYQASL